MAGEPHLLLELRGHLFAMRAQDVREVTRLPALAPIAEVPRHVAGLLNLRGRLVPVVDLAVRMGYEPTPRSPDQAVVVLQRGRTLTGILVDRVEDFVDVEDADVRLAPDAPAGVVPATDTTVRSMVKLGARVAMLLDLDEVLYQLRPEDEERAGGDLAANAFDMPDDARDVMRKRARSLAQPIELVEEVEAPPLVLVQIGGETFAVPAAAALEFVRLDDLTPVPSCPRHIAGHASLRGDILVVLDLRHILGLDASRPQERLRAMLVRTAQETPVAILVDEVLDVAEASAVEALPEASRGSTFIGGSVVSGGRRIPILDAERVVTAPEIVVKEDA